MRQRSLRTAAAASAMALGLFAGWYFVWSAGAPSSRTPAPPPAPKPSPDLTARDRDLPPVRTGERPAPGLRGDPDADAAGALRNQRTLRFKDADALARFLKSIEGKGIAVLGRIDALLTLRVGFLSLDELNGLLDDSIASGFIYPVWTPEPAGDLVQQGAVGFGNSLLGWLGITGDNSLFGKGVKIAVLDTGVSPTSKLSYISNVMLVAGPENLADWNGHGTAVADLIRQIAPSSEILSWRVANDEGRSDSFLLAQAIMEAIAAGAEFINISLGSDYSSPVLADAVAAAYQAGVAIYASTGNKGADQVSFPAAYETVYGIGAVEKGGEVLNFSNAGDVAFVAPGLELNTAWTNQENVLFSGTSASSPIAAAIGAIVSSELKYGALQASEYTSSHLNDVAAPGYDEISGGGIALVDRLLLANTPGIYDAAVTSNYISYDAQGNPSLQVTVQNRGTELLVNSSLEITTSLGTTLINVSTLAPEAIATYTVPIPGDGQPQRIQSHVEISGNQADRTPSDNRRIDIYTPADSP